MVRLKEFSAYDFVPVEFDFNSSMVRLKDRATDGTIAMIQFQFLYGAIKSSISILAW